jgi:hypothetical protein
LDVQNIVNKVVGGVLLALFVGILIYILVAFGNAIIPLGGVQAANIIDQGITTLIVICSISGVIGFIELAKLITEHFEGLSGW